MRTKWFLLQLHNDVAFSPQHEMNANLNPLHEIFNMNPLHLWSRVSALKSKRNLMDSKAVLVGYSFRSYDWDRQNRRRLEEKIGKAKWIRGVESVTEWILLG